MKRLVRFTLCLSLFGLFISPTQAFTSLYIFGDGVSTTTNGPGGAIYYGNRFCNGYVWVEDLATLQGLTYVSTRNWSYFGHTSTNLVANVSAFIAPADVSTALFVVWVNDADLLTPATYYGTDMTLWTASINQSQTNHLTAIQTLYNKGVRTLIMPNAVDLSKVPFFIYSPNTNFIRLRCIDYNVAFSNTLNQARASFSGLKIYSPDFYGLLANLITYPSSYGVTNAGIDALSDPYLSDKSLNGPGANYIFWDYLDPTAKVHLLMGTIAHQIVSLLQPTITKFTFQGASNKLDVVNIPMARDGIVQGSTTLTSWSTVKNILNSTNASQSIFVPASSSPQQYYRLRF